MISPADVLNLKSAALLLTDVEHEHPFLLALGRPPETHYKAFEGITPRLQRWLDVLELSPAFIRTATWDVVAWNRAALAVLGDYESLEPGQRNIPTAGLITLEYSSFSVDGRSDLAVVVYNPHTFGRDMRSAVF